MANYKSFPQDFWDQISRALDTATKKNSRPVAAFDADGTLWDMDMGESFFKWQIQNCNLPDLPKDPWKHYRDWKASGDPRPAYLWLAQINHGQKISKVRQWATEALGSHGEIPVFEEQRKLIEFLQKNHVDVYVITASIKWAVEPGAQLLGISQDHVLGVASKVDKNGIVQKEQDGIITYREGKPEALKAKTGKFPFFASGNTMGDFALLQSATDLRLAVGATKSGHELFATEEELRQKAKASGWMNHQF
jgi:HAD superfamily phosphoserine phosphatase-like hydrolase